MIIFKEVAELREHVAVSQNLEFEDIAPSLKQAARKKIVPIIGQALARTKNIRLGAGAHLLPYHHPVELAHRIAYIDSFKSRTFTFSYWSWGSSY